ncbi:MAG TPA: hypothetical protein VHL52_05925 [Acidimicrobiia bacterium]|nr:hypothetical protein [Acidimicrobiia bacterium]
MRRLVWTKMADGWRSGRYRIDLVTPGMWALVVDDSKDESASRLITTSPSLQSLKHEAQRQDGQRRRHLALWKSVIGMALIVMAFVLLPELPPGWMVAAIVAVTLSALRALAVVVITLTNAPWTRLRQTYQ